MAVKNGILTKKQVNELTKWTEKRIKYLEQPTIKVRVIENLIEDTIWAEIQILEDGEEFAEINNEELIIEETTLHKAAVAATQVLEDLQKALKWQIEDGEVTLYPEVKFEIWR